nr:apoptosis-associated speck-like protein containing a CARD isoform X1 [Labrus bergylta]
MAPKTKKAALADMLENLSKSDFDKFCSHLLDRREEPRVRRRQVEGKNFLQIADVLVSTFTEAGAVKVAVELLGCANCGQEVEELVTVIAGLDSKPGTRDTARPSAGATGVDTTSDDQHFVDKYKLQLTDRVSHMDPILDRLLDRGVLQREAYDTIRALPTSQKKMRELYCGCLKAGTASKDVFYQILLENEKFLIDDLNTKH